MNLSDLVTYLDTELRTAQIADYAPALNGLQLENHRKKVSKIVAAVDATLPVMRKAVEAGADLMLVHHGMFWSGLQPWTGPVFQKLMLCHDNGLAVYSSHLPLDVHPRLGNNAQIALALDLKPTGGFLEYKGNAIGVLAEAEVPLVDLVAQFKDALGGGAVNVCGAGPAVARKIGISSGGSGSEVAAAAKAGVDTFITGEGPHWSYTLAEELGINVLYGGHYATETFGVKALAAHIEREFGIPWEFVDHPTGL